MSTIVPKYRRLSFAELQELEKEFIDFLVVNGITAPDWEKLKSDQSEKCEDILTLFSDVVLEGVLQQVQFLEYRTEHEIQAFQCLPQKLVVVGLRSTNPTTNFTDPNFLSEALKNPPSGIKIFTSDKPYQTARESELFGMLQSGCLISDGALFKTLSLAYYG